tara:strand:+ start:967 stop:1665 length:699 start_codon:yes stop_codon:yes gene_type:complete
MIPARIGSERLKFKNLALINNKPLINYSIESAKKSQIFDKIVLNADHEVFEKIAKKNNIEFYLRPKKFGGSNVKSDDVVFDFINNFKKFETLVWVNSIAPFQTEDDIKNCINYFFKNKLDSLITTTPFQLHGIYKKKPINFDKNKKFSKTQDLKIIEIFLYSIMMWKTKKFLKSYIKNNYGITCGKFGTFPIEKDKSILIKHVNDLEMANYYMSKKTNKKFKIKYDDLVKKI